MPAFEADKARFAERNAQVVGISVDSIASHIAWQKQSIGKLSYPLCSDFYPHGSVIQRYGLLREGPPVPGITERAVVVVDKAGAVRWKKVYDLGAAPDNAEILKALEALS